LGFRLSDANLAVLAAGIFETSTDFFNPSFWAIRGASVFSSVIRNNHLVPSFIEGVRAGVDEMEERGFQRDPFNGIMPE
jgi:hypothetical protein